MRWITVVLALSLGALSRVDGADLYRIAVGTKPGAFEELTARYRTVLSIPGQFVDALLSAREAEQLRRSGFRLEYVQSDPEAWMRRIASEPGRGLYRTSEEIEAELKALARRAPELVRLEKIGAGWETEGGRPGRPIWAIGLGTAAGARGAPAALFLGGVHSRELATSEVLVDLASSWVTRHGRDPEVRALLATRRIWIVPLLNPDGREYVLSVDPWWRKNRHRFTEANAVGVDLNRNFPFHWSSGVGSSDSPGSPVFRGEGPASEPETASLCRFVERIEPRVSLSFHAYGEYILTPYGYPGREPEEPELYRILERQLSALTGYTAGTVGSLLGYHSSGRHDDWLYGTRRVLSAEMELGRTFFPGPGELAGVSRVADKACRYMARLAGSWVTATLLPPAPGDRGGAISKAHLRFRNSGLTDALEVRWRFAGDQTAIRPAAGIVERVPGLVNGGGAVDVPVERTGPGEAARLPRLHVIVDGHDRVLPLEWRPAGQPLE